MKSAKSLDQMTGYLVNQVAERFRDATARALSDLGVKPRQMGLLVVLRDEGALSQQELGLRAHMDRTTVMQQVRDLARSGYVDRSTDPDDARSQKVRLTARGRRCVEVGERRASAVADELLAPLSKRQRLLLDGLLKKLI
jgi:DNA-binding MarR family transcriptional regulator